MENNKDGILLETGTNEIEIMEFTIDGNLYGINVAKVREIMLSAPVHPMPHAHPAVEGIFKPRDIVITVVDLPEYLSGHTEPKGEKDLFIITNFNKMHIAFRVHTVVGISRISWRDIQKPDNRLLPVVPLLLALMQPVLLPEPLPVLPKQPRPSSPFHISMVMIR